MRRIGLRSAVLLVVASMVGAGVFGTSGFALADLGSRGAVLLAWAIGGALAACGAVSYGALALRFPTSGGEYDYLSRTLHPLLGFLAGWVSLLVGFTAPIAFAAGLLPHYVEPWLGGGLRAEWLGTVAIVVVAAPHWLGVRAGTRAQDAIVLLKLATMVGFVAWGAFAIASRGTAVSDPVPAAGFSWSKLAVSLVWIYLAYSGWNAAAYVGGEVVDPRRNLSRSLLLGTLLVTGLYLALNAVFVFAAPIDELAGRPEIALVAAQALGGRPLAAVTSALVALALLTSISAMVMAGPRVYARMAADGLFPRRLVQHDGPPRAAIALQVVLALAFLWSWRFEALMTYIGYTLGLSSALTVVGLLVLRRREGPARVPIPGHPWVPLAYVAGVVAVSVAGFPERPTDAALGLATVLAGVPAYAWFRRRSR